MVSFIEFKKLEVITILALDISKNTLFITSFIFLVVSNIFLRKYYKIEASNKKEGKKFHIISIILYSIAVILFFVQFFYE